MSQTSQRFTKLHRGPLENDIVSIPVPDIYRFSETLSIDHIPLASHETHTMFNAIDRYVSQKLPTQDLERVIALGGSLEVHGVYPKHFDFVFHDELTSGQLVEIPFYHRPTTRKYNVVRPRFFRSSNFDRLIISLAPGSDYIMHYGAMLRHLCPTRKAIDSLQLFHYPVAFGGLALWTKLNAGFIWPQDTVIIGYVDEMATELQKWINLTPISTASNPYFESRRYQLENGRILNFLGVNFSFWGNLSKPIANEICEAGASELIYVGKLGSMTTPHSLYNQLFSPTRYVTLDHDRIKHQVDNLTNNLVKCFPELDSGLHTSVPTVVEEDYLQRAVCDRLGAQSIDNEISQIAKSISDFNRSTGASVSYSSFHFATDYVRRFEERFIETDHDLSKNRDLFAIAQKDRTLKACAKLLATYLEK